VLGIAAALPEQVRTNDWWPTVTGREQGDVFEQPSAEVLRARGVDPEVVPHFLAEAGDPFLGARKRRVLEQGRSPSDLEREAALAAMSRAGIAPEAIDLLVVFSHVTDVAAPSNAPLLADRLGLRSDVLSLSAGREGASLPLHLELASSLMHSGPYEHALLIQSAVMSRVMKREHLTSRVVGDAAVAAVVGRVPDGFGVLGFRHHTMGDYFRMAQLLPAQNTDIPWYRGDAHQAALCWQSPVPELSRKMGAQIASVFEAVARPLLDACGLEPADVTHLVAYEPRPWVPSAFCERLGIPPSRSSSRFGELGYTLAASSGLVLEGLVAQERVARGDLVLVYSEGAGASSSGCLIRWH